MKNLKVFLFTAFLGITSCGGGNDEPVLQELTPLYVAEKLFYSFGGLYDYTYAVAVLPYDGLRDDGTIDLDRLIIGKARTAASANHFVWAYGVDLPADPGPDLFVVFYIDTDSGATGEPIDGIMADKLFMTNQAFKYTTPAAYSAYYTWDNINTEWVAATGTEDNFNDFFGVPPKPSYVKGINTYYDATISGIFGLANIQGVLKVQEIPTADPNSIMSTVDSTAVFTFSTPAL